jgi:cytochrome P450
MAAPFTDLPTIDFPENAVITGTMSTFLAQTALQRGPIFNVHTSTEGDFVFMVGPEANRFVMHTHREHFSHDLGWTPVVGDWLGKGLLNMDPPEHTVHRRMMNPAFTSSYLAAYLPLMHQVIVDRVGDWIGRDSVDLQVEAREIAFDVAAVALAGLKTGSEVDRLRELFYGLLHGFDDTIETWEQFWQRRLAILNELDRTLLRMISARRVLASDEQPRDVLAKIVQARDERGEMLSDAQLLAHVKILLVAGHETTTSLGAWVLYLLAKREEYRRRVEAEIAALGIPTDEALTFEQLRSLHVLDLVVRETGRLYSPVLNLPRGVVRDFEFGGYQVPAGTQVRLAIAACHRLPTVFDEPDVFDPERFEPPRDEDTRTPYALTTFGGGPRTCIGMSFAQLEVKALAAHVLRAVKLQPLPGQDLHHAGFWTAFVPNGIWVTARQRG